MKRIIAAVSFAVLAVPAFAAEVSAPYEQINIDRALPNIPERAVDERASAGATKLDSGIWAHDHNFVAPPQ